MNANVAEALRRLRAADPAAEAGDEPWAGSPAEEMARQRLHEPDIISIDAPDTSSNNSRARRWPAIAAAAAVAALAIGIGAAALTSSQSGEAPTRHSPRLGDTPPRSALSNRVKAEALVERLLAHAPVLPNATRHAASPGGIAFGGSTFGSAHMVSRTAWWTAPGTVGGAISYVTTHASPGLHANGSSGSMSGPGRDFRWVEFGAQARNYAADPTLQISVTPYRGGVAVQAQVQAIWVPRRPAWTRIIEPREVAVTVQRGAGHPAVHRTLRGSDLHRLAHMVNALRVAPDLGVEHCPIALPDQDQVLQFTTSARTVTAHVMTTGCTGVTMSAKGHRPFHLEPGALSRTVLNLLGLKPIRR